MEILNQIKDAAIKSDFDIHFFMFILFCLAVIDVASGVINAWIEGNISSKKMKIGLLGKLYEVIIVVISAILDYILDMNVITKGTIIFYSIQEILSILENTARYISYPKFIKDALEVLNKHKGGDIDGTRS